MCYLKKKSTYLVDGSQDDLQITVDQSDHTLIKTFKVRLEQLLTQKTITMMQSDNYFFLQLVT